MPIDEEFQRVRNQLKVCPTCGKPLELRDPGTSILKCPDALHGSFVIVWSRVDNRYYVHYQIKARAGVGT